MFRKWIGFLLSLGIVVLTACSAAAEETGTLQVIPTWCGESVAGGTVSVCRIGVEGMQGIQVTDGLANWTMEEQDILSEDWINWVLQQAGEEKQADVSDNGAWFSGLPEGIYLVRHTESNPFYSEFDPFLVSVPTEDGWAVIRKPAVINLEESPQTGDRPAPIIGAMGIGFSVAALMVLADNRKK